MNAPNDQADDVNAAVFHWVCRDLPLYCIICKRQLTEGEPVEVVPMRWNYRADDGLGVVAAIFSLSCPHHDKDAIRRAMTEVLNMPIMVNT